MTPYATGLENHSSLYRNIVKDSNLANDQDKIVTLFKKGDFTAAHELAKKKYDEMLLLKDGRVIVQVLLRETYYTTLIHYLTYNMEIAYHQSNRTNAAKIWNELNIIFNRSDLSEVYPQLYGMRYIQQLIQIFNKYDTSAGKDIQTVNRLILGL